MAEVETKIHYDGPEVEGRIYDEVEIEDMEFDEDEQVYYYPCPCGDKFFLELEEILEGETIATCPSCSLRIRVVYNPEDFEGLLDDDVEPQQVEVAA